jgi:mevalonate kinase
MLGGCKIDRADNGRVLTYCSLLGKLPDEPALQEDLTRFLETLCGTDRGQIAFLFLLIGISRNKFVNPNCALACFLYLTLSCPVSITQGISVHVKSEFQPGVGMGSSAAYNVALAGALLEHFDRTNGNSSNSGHYNESKARDWQCVWSPKAHRAELINKWAFQAEKIMHGTPSGVDNAICTYGTTASGEFDEICVPVHGD